MRYLPPLVLHGAHRVSEPELEAHALVFAERLLGYPAWTLAVPLEDEPEVPLDERPALFSSLEGDD